jgi:HK97 family phage prohead protease
MSTTKSAPERRYLPRAELRAVEQDGKPTVLVGQAIVYNSPSEDLGGFVETIKPGAFTESLKTTDLRALVDHNTSLILGRQSSGTLRIKDGPRSMAVEIDLPDTSYARDLVVSVDRGDMSGMSFSFLTIEDEWFTDADGNTSRTVIKADIVEVSAVTFPAYPETTLALRSLDRWQHERSAAVPICNDEVARLRVRLHETSFR